MMDTPVTCWIVGYLREVKELLSNVTGLWISTGINDQKKVQIIIFLTLAQANTSTTLVCSSSQRLQLGVIIK